MINNPELKPELKLCPCCSERAEACRQGDWHIVECIEVECGLRTQGFATKEWAIKAWNERPVSQPVEQAAVWKQMFEINKTELHLARDHNSVLRKEKEELKSSLSICQEALKKCQTSFKYWNGGGVTSGHYFKLQEARDAVNNALDGNE
jgi:hypothetical protein